jgi:hypothetical protein
MPPAKLAVAGVVGALALSACGSTAKPEAGAARLSIAKPAGRGVVDDPRAKHIKCLQALNLPVIEQGRTNLLIGAPPNQVTAMFVPTPGGAQDDQISGHAQGAEAIGNGLLFPGAAPDAELQGIESCLGIGVKG